MTTVKEIVSRIEKFAPKSLAEDWDPVGLAFGSMNQEVHKMMIALDLDAMTLKEAQENDVDFIFTHHPPIFKSLTTLNEHDTRRKEYIELIKSDISLYAAHTNVDAAENGMNDWLANSLSLKSPIEVLDTTTESSYKLLVLYTPLEDAESIRRALHKKGAGQVGDYDNVSYNTRGTGRFIPSEKAKPAIGQPNKAEQVIEERIEVLVKESLIGQIIQTIYEVHPYEEPVFHLFDIGKKDKEFGMGRVGSLAEPITIQQLVEKVKEAYHLPFVRCANVNLEQKVERVAILGGSGEKYYKKALEKEADIYITGDISYHGAQDMIRDGLPFIDPSHFIENIFVEKMTEKLKKWKEEENWSLEIIPASKQKDVFTFK